MTTPTALQSIVPEAVILIECNRDLTPSKDCAATRHQQHQRMVPLFHRVPSNDVSAKTPCRGVNLEVRFSDEAVQHSRAIRVGTGNPSLIV
jgi:hypothetical protein